ncbi:MAG: PilZ domain-containing protein [Sporolactobacillus sp.]
MVFAVGETLRLKCIRPDDVEQILRCKLAEESDNELIVNYPIDVKTGKAPVMIDGAKFEVSVVSGNQVLVFRAVFERRIHGKVPLIALSYGGDSTITRVQRRNFVRVETYQNVAIYSREGTFSPFVSLTGDISGGGTLISLTEPTDMKMGDPVELWFSLFSSISPIRYLRINGQVMRIFEERETNLKKASIGFEFESESDRQPIIRFCFEKQLEERRKLLNMGQRLHRR